MVIIVIDGYQGHCAELPAAVGFNRLPERKLPFRRHDHRAKQQQTRKDFDSHNFMPQVILIA